MPVPFRFGVCECDEISVLVLYLRVHISPQKIVETKTM